MICCDQCEEWYHGDCVGISVGQGKRMEREGKEYVCPVCVARLQDAKEEREMNRYTLCALLTYNHIILYGHLCHCRCLI